MAVLRVDVPHREAMNIIVQVERLDLAFAELQQAWDDFRKVGGWTATERRVHDAFGNYVCSADDAPVLYRFLSKEEDDALRIRDGYDVPFKVTT